jgi:hypothetical protein
VDELLTELMNITIAAIKEFCCNFQGMLCSLTVKTCGFEVNTEDPGKQMETHNHQD